MNKTLMSFLKASALAIALYACTEDAERLQQSDDASNIAAATTTTTTTDGVAKSALTKDVGAPIPYADAKRWMRNYRTAFPTEIKSRFFGKNTFEEILSKSKTVGISINYAIDDNGKPLLLLVGVNDKGQLMMTKPSSNGKLSEVEMSYGYDVSLNCPPACGTEEEEN